MYKINQVWDRFVKEQMSNPNFVKEYKKAVEEIKAVDSFINSINLDGIENGMTKEELARRIYNSPAALKLLIR